MRRLAAAFDRSPIEEIFQQRRIHDELGVLSRRAKLIYRAISLGTTSALLICFVIAALFVGNGVGLLFVAAMVALIAALLLFLREVFLATRILRIGPS